MNDITRALYERLSGDATLIALLGAYQGSPAIFTTDPAPGDAQLPYIVAAGEVAVIPFDTKVTRGRRVTRDVRCYAAAGGSAIPVEQIAERCRQLLHRQALVIPGFVWLMSECSGPVAADEDDAYGRILTVTLTIEEV